MGGRPPGWNSWNSSPVYSACISEGPRATYMYSICMHVGSLPGSLGCVCACWHARSRKDQLSMRALEWSAGHSHLAALPTYVCNQTSSWCTLWSVSTWKYVCVEEGLRGSLWGKWCYQLFCDHEPPALPQLHVYTCDDFYTVCTWLRI